MRFSVGSINVCRCNIARCEELVSAATGLLGRGAICVQEVSSWPTTLMGLPIAGSWLLFRRAGSFAAILLPSEFGHLVHAEENSERVASVLIGRTAVVSFYFPDVSRNIHEYVEAIEQCKIIVRKLVAKGAKYILLCGDAQCQVKPSHKKGYTGSSVSSACGGGHEDKMRADVLFTLCDEFGLTVANTFASAGKNMYGSSSNVCRSDGDGICSGGDGMCSGDSRDSRSGGDGIRRGGDGLGGVGWVG